MIIRRKLTAKYTAIPNEICNNQSISTDARWCLWYLLTKPHDWIIRIKDIQEVSSWGRDKVYKAITELIEIGYIIKSEIREKGRYATVEYTVLDEPITENTITEKSITENTHLTNDLHSPITESITKDGIQKDFNDFWAAYPKRPSNPQHRAFESYKKARKDKVSHETIMAGLKAYSKTRENQDAEFTAMAATWLNQKRWTDDYGPVKVARGRNFV